NTTNNAPPSWRRAALAGLSIGIASMFHVLGAIWGLSLVVADFAMRRKPAWVAWSVAGACGALPLISWLTWIFYHHLGQIWMMQFWEQAVLMRSAGDSWWLRPRAELRQFLGQNELVPFYVITLMVGAGAWCYLRRWRDPNQRFVLGGFLSSLLLVTFFMGKGTGAYPLYWFIWLVPVSAFGWSALLKVASPRRKKLSSAFVAVGLANPFVWQAITIGVAYYQYEGRNYSQVSEFIARNVPPGSNVCGRPEFWYAVESSGSVLRIWTKPDPFLHDFCIVNPDQTPPPGFSFVNKLPNRLRTIHGFYFSGINYAADLYVSKRIDLVRKSGLTSSTQQSQAERPHL